MFSLDVLPTKQGEIMLRIDSEFQSLIPKLTTDEYNLLEESILADGCRDALVVWNGIIIDGHNRYEICSKHDLPYETTPIIFDSKDEAKIWIINNQLGRRNLPSIDRGILALKKKEILAKKAKENQLSGLKQYQDDAVYEIFPKRTDLLPTLAKSEPIDTGKELAKEAKISDRTLDKIEKIAKESTPEIIQSIRDGDLTINKAYKEMKREEKREQIKEQFVEPKIPNGLFDVIYADPPWKYEFAESSNREIENQYPTMELKEIMDLDIPSADDCVLLLWATSPKLEEAMQILNAWGFTYRTCAVWDKEIIGMGYWFRQQHEILLLGIKGNPKCPDTKNRESSVFHEKRGRHSKKPSYYYEMIESMFPDKRYIEYFARNEREGWSSYGNEK
jgi:N6-adenosine-specific RNA methylase IME4